MQGSILNVLRTVLPLDNGPMLLFQKLNHPFFFPLVEHTIVSLPHPVSKLHPGEFRLVQADWRFPFCAAQVQRIVTLIILIIIVVGHLW